jgi:hypothetical protein
MDIAGGIREGLFVGHRQRAFSVSKKLNITMVDVSFSVFDLI